MNDQTPILQEILIGINATGKGHETDSMGGIDVPADRYWGAQTQRSLVHFSIGDDHMPKSMMKMRGPMQMGIMAKDLDVGFICGMIPHHEGADDMAELS